MQATGRVTFTPPGLRSEPITYRWHAPVLDAAAFAAFVEAHPPRGMYRVGSAQGSYESGVYVREERGVRIAYRHHRHGVDVPAAVEAPAGPVTPHQARNREYRLAPDEVFMGDVYDAADAEVPS